MYAIVEDSGTQIRVAEGDEFEIDLRDEQKREVRSSSIACS